MEVAGVGKRKERPKRRGEKRRSYAMSGRGRNREGEGEGGKGKGTPSTGEKRWEGGNTVKEEFFGGEGPFPAAWPSSKEKA